MLTEYLAVLDKVTTAVNALSTQLADQLACRSGCSRCCADGLSVLPVEAAAIRAHLIDHPIDPQRGTEGCAFLDHEGSCRIYAARPLLCRTHGLPLRINDPQSNRGLRIINNLATCELNFTERAPQPHEALDAERVLALLVVVNERYLQHSHDDPQRVLLSSLANR
jgi:uncharacterized protein